MYDPLNPQPRAYFRCCDCGDRYDGWTGVLYDENLETVRQCREKDRLAGKPDHVLHGLLLPNCPGCNCQEYDLYCPFPEDRELIEELLSDGHLNLKPRSIKGCMPPPVDPPPTPGTMPPPPELSAEDQAALDAAAQVLARNQVAFRSLFGRAWKLMETIDQAALGIEQAQKADEDKVGTSDDE